MADMCFSRQCSATVTHSKLTNTANSSDRPINSQPLSGLSFRSNNQNPRINNSSYSFVEDDRNIITTSNAPNTLVAIDSFGSDMSPTSSLCFAKRICDANLLSIDYRPHYLGQLGDMSEVEMLLRRMNIQPDFYKDSRSPLLHAI